MTDEGSTLRVFWFVLVLLLAAVALNNVGCTPAQTRTGTVVLNTITDIADPTYQIALDSCDAARDAIVARQGTTYEQDIAAMGQINQVCDGIVLGFETLRGSQLTARAAIAEGLSGAAAAAITNALDLWRSLQELVPQIMTLGLTSGGAE